MRRPRGPGGRFLTAEEIAAQRSPTGDEPGPSTVPDHDEDMEDEDGDVGMQPMAMPPDSFNIHSDLMNMAAYRDMQPMAHLPPPVQAPPQQQQGQAGQPQHHHQRHQPLHPHFGQQQQQQQSHSQHSHTVTLSSPYAASMQMHHVPHPHAHARHRHLTFAQDMYGSPNPDAEMQRRTEEMIQFAAGPSGS
jgi:hypothetical protein